MGIRPIRDRQFLKQRGENQIVLLHAGETFLEIDPKIVTGPLGIRLRVIAAH